MDITVNKNFVKLFLSHFETGDAAKLLEMMSDDATWWVNGKPHLFAFAGLKTKTEMRSVFDELFKSFDGGLKMEMTSSIGEGDVVAVEARSFAVTNSGKAYENEYHILFRLRNSKVVEVREYTDPMHAIDVLS